MKLMKKGTIHDVINGWQQNKVDVGDDDAEWASYCRK